MQDAIRRGTEGVAAAVEAAVVVALAVAGFLRCVLARGGAPGALSSRASSSVPTIPSGWLAG
jgi:hypothetical protein